MTQDKETSVLTESNPSAPCNDENAKQRERKEKNFQTKVVIRRLPPTMTQEQFLEQIDPLPENDYFYFVKGDMSLGIYAFSRAYISFVVREDIFIFKDKFDGYVFVDAKGNEYSAIVEFAPFQKIPKKRAKKKDAKSGTIEQDPDYLKFLESLENPDDSVLPSAETYLEEIEARERELKSNSGVPKMTTPLIEYLKQRKMERQKMREEKREERKRRDLERKRIREEERRRRKVERGANKDNNKDPPSSAEGGGSSKEQQEGTGDEGTTDRPPVLKLLKNPERETSKDASNVKPSASRGGGAGQKSGARGGRRGEWDRSNRDRERQRERERAAAARERERTRRLQREKEDRIAGKQGDHRSSQPVKGFATKETSRASSSVAGCKEKQKAEPPPKQTEDRQVKEYSPEPPPMAEGGGQSRDSSKDPRLDRRIRNKDRPSLEIYRPGMRKIGGSTQRGSPQKEVPSNSSTPSPSISPTQQDG